MPGNGFFSYHRFRKDLQLQGASAPELLGTLLGFSLEKFLEHIKEYFVSGCLKQDKVPRNGVFSTIDLEKAFSFRRLCLLTPTGGVAPCSHQRPSQASRPPTFRLFSLPPFPSLTWNVHSFVDCPFKTSLCLCVCVCVCVCVYLHLCVCSVTACCNHFLFLGLEIKILYSCIFKTHYQCQ